MVTADPQSPWRKSWLRKGLAYIVIFLGVVGLIASIVLGVILYQVGSFLGETWGKANAGLKQSSQTLLAAQDTVDVTGATVRLLEEGLGDASAATNSIDSGLSTAEQSTGNFANSLSAFGSSLEAAGNAIPPTGGLERMGASLREAGSEARDASQGLTSLNPVWQDLREQNADIKGTLDNIGQQLPQVRRSLAGVSQGLKAGAVAINSVASDLEVLRGSGLFLGIFIGGLMYFSALSLCLILLGLLFLTMETTGD